ncbi:DUF4142 domain-containing protein [bacterium]|nr:DUF4142 domain-containing protein [bacterium]
MKHSNRALVLGAMSLLLAACGTGIQEPVSRAQLGVLEARTEAMDAMFANKVAVVNMAEVALGKLAQANGGSQAVKDYGRKMEQDHSMANEKLTAIATKKGMTLPKDLDAEHKALYERLSKLTGKAFDTAYREAMVKGHEKAIKLFEEEIAKGQDADLKDFATKTLPTLKEHLKLAEQLPG